MYISLFYYFGPSLASALFFRQNIQRRSFIFVKEANFTFESPYFFLHSSISWFFTKKNLL